MRADFLADKAFGGDTKAEGEDMPMGDPTTGGNPELEAQMSKLLKAIATKDTAAMAAAFEGAKEACESYGPEEE